MRLSSKWMKLRVRSWMIKTWASSFLRVTPLLYVASDLAASTRRDHSHCETGQSQPLSQYRSWYEKNRQTSLHNISHPILQDTFCLIRYSLSVTETYMPCSTAKLMAPSASVTRTWTSEINTNCAIRKSTWARYRYQYIKLFRGSISYATAITHITVAKTQSR